MTVGEAYSHLYAGALVILAILIGVMLIRSIIGPGVTDRIVSINMICTMTVACIAILSAYLAESYLLDVALIYTMISFVTVLILASVYIPAKTKRSGFASDDESVGDSGKSGRRKKRPRTKSRRTGR